MNRGSVWAGWAGRHPPRADRASRAGRPTTRPAPVATDRRSLRAHGGPGGDQRRLHGDAGDRGEAREHATGRAGDRSSCHRRDPGAGDDRQRPAVLGAPHGQVLLGPERPRPQPGRHHLVDTGRRVPLRLREGSAHVDRVERAGRSARPARRARGSAPPPGRPRTRGRSGSLATARDRRGAGGRAAPRPAGRRARGRSPRAPWHRGGSAHTAARTPAASRPSTWTTTRSSPSGPMPRPEQRSRVGSSTSSSTSSSIARRRRSPLPTTAAAWSRRRPTDRSIGRVLLTPWSVTVDRIAGRLPASDGRRSGQPTSGVQDRFLLLDMDGV